MTNAIRYILSAWTLCGSMAFAQQSAETYFTETLQTGNVYAPSSSRNLQNGDIEATRTALWQQWISAVKACSPAKLPPLAPLETPSKGRLTLPDSLEPNAVMPFYWGYKGVICEEGNSSVPTFLYIHGSGPKTHEWAASLHWAQVFADAPSRYFIPQIPQEGQYYRWWHRSKQWAWRWLWNQLMTHPGTDPDRIYIFGISEGGYGSQRLASFYADYLAAAGPMAGGEPLQNAPAENLEHIGFSLLTGENDFMFFRNQYTQTTNEALDSLQKLYPGSYAHRVELLPGRGHNFDYRPTTPWLVQFRRNPWPRHFVWEDFEMDGWHRKGFYNLRIDKRPSDTIRTRYEVNIAPDGVIDIKADNVEYIPLAQDAKFGFTLTLKWAKRFTPATNGAFTLYLDEHLVDLGQEVTVRVNGVEKFSGKLKLNECHMMESLATFGDPRRIYPAAVRLDF